MASTTSPLPTYRYTVLGRRNGRTNRLVVRATDRAAAIRAAQAKRPGFLADTVSVEAGAPASALARTATTVADVEVADETVCLLDCCAPEARSYPVAAAVTSGDVDTTRVYLAALIAEMAR
ncbi:MAG: hypothetical protein ACRDXE_01480 [Acidimicrobiales bacterium]